MSTINYDHSRNLHLLNGPSIVFPVLNEKYSPKSVLDVGCGLGTWLKAISENGIKDFLGVDGINVPDEQFFVSKEKFKQQDLANEWSLRRKFDLVISFEVAEHLPPNSADNFVRCLVEHGNLIVFSAACPYQEGQGHINCQWPSYWQNIFNKYGFVCSDEIRALIWEEDFPEYWYKQNIFVAKKNPEEAGNESRILPIIHPQLYEYMHNSKQRLVSGQEALSFYINVLPESFWIFC